jgi:hypothetical protein
VAVENPVADGIDTVSISVSLSLILSGKVGKLHDLGFLAAYNFFLNKKRKKINKKMINCYLCQCDFIFWLILLILFGIFFFFFFLVRYIYIYISLFFF